MAFDKTKLEVIHRGTVGGIAYASYDAGNDYFSGSGIGGGTGVDDNINADGYFNDAEVPNKGMVIEVIGKARLTASPNTITTRFCTVRAYPPQLIDSTSTATNIKAVNLHTPVIASA